ncbi:TPA: hypothetical protein H3N45_002917 [Listeria monocytogenes]|nr:hypothetical protein [Listeria monocytogenes]
MPHKKIRIKKKREEREEKGQEKRSREKVKRKGQEIRATTTTPQPPAFTKA